MTKTTVKKKVPTLNEVRSAALQFRALWLEKQAIEEKLKPVREQLSEMTESYLKHHNESHIDDQKLSIREGGCIMKLSVKGKIELPDDMSKVTDKKLIQFCKKYPGAVKLELVKANLKMVPLGEWGIKTSQERKIEIEVADRGEVDNGN